MTPPYQIKTLVLIFLKSLSAMYHGMISNVFRRWLLIICQLLKACEYRVLFLGLKIVIEKKLAKAGILCLRACLHGGGGPQVGEVTRLAVVEK